MDILKDLSCSVMEDLGDLSGLCFEEYKRREIEKYKKGEITLERKPKQIEENPVQIGNQSFEAGNKLMKDHKYDEALDRFRHSLELREEHSGKYNADTGLSCFRIGYVHLQRKQYADALDYFRRAYRIKAQLWRRERGGSNIIGWIERAVESISKEIEREEYIAMLKHSANHEHRGDQLAQDGDFQKALSAFETALLFELRGQKDVDSRFPRVVVDEADLHIKIARIHALQEGYDEALLHFRKAVRILKGSAIRYKAYTNQIYVEISIAVAHKGYGSESVAMYLDSLHTSCAHEATGDWHFRLFQHDKALYQYQQSLQVEKTGVCQCDLSIAMLYAKLVDVYGGVCDLPSALVYSYKVRDIYGTTLGFNHRSTIAISKKIHKVLKPLTDRNSPERRTVESFIRKPRRNPLAFVR
jgi:tetratricopeptide (TPR) repeat protein